jgi:hypothetical protein
MFQLKKYKNCVPLLRVNHLNKRSNFFYIFEGWQKSDPWWCLLGLKVFFVCLLTTFQSVSCCCFLESHFLSFSQRFFCHLVRNHFFVWKKSKLLTRLVWPRKNIWRICFSFFPFFLFLLFNKKKFVWKCFKWRKMKMKMTDFSYTS